MQVRANIELLADRPRQADWRPSHNMGSLAQPSYFIGRIVIGDVPLQPGETRRLDVEFIGEWAAELHPGHEWTLHEGTRLVARATLVEILPLPQGGRRRGTYGN